MCMRMRFYVVSMLISLSEVIGLAPNCPAVQEYSRYSAWSSIKSVSVIPYSYSLDGVEREANSTFLSGGEDGKIILWDVASSTTIKEFTIANSNSVPSLEVLPSYAFLAATGYGMNAELFHFDSGANAVKSFSSPSLYSKCLKYLGDGTFLSGYYDRKIIRWNIETMAKIMIYSSHDGYVTCLGLLQDGTFISGSTDGTVKRWDVGSSSAKETFYYGADVHALLVLDGYHFLAAGGSLVEGRSIVKFKIGTPTPVFQYNAAHPNYIVALLLVGSSIVSIGADGLSYRWELGRKDPVTKYATGEDTFSSAYLGDGTFITGGRGKSIKRFSLYGYWSGDLSISVSSAPYQCCSTYLTAVPSTFLVPCFEGAPSNPGNDTIPTPCSSPSPGSYVSAVCVGGSTDELGRVKVPGSDTVTTPCPTLEEGMFQLYSRTCSSGDAMTVGSPSVIGNCTFPSGEEYVASRCEKGDLTFTGGSDTSLADCSPPSDGQYVVEACQSGDPYRPGSNSKIAPCQDPSSTINTYTTAECVKGDVLNPGVNTKISSCLEPPSGHYTTAVCERGSRFTLGRNTKVEACSKVINPSTQVIKTPCEGGSSSARGSDSVIASSCSIGSILDTSDSTLPCVPCDGNKSTSKAGSERCDVCLDGFYMKATGRGEDEDEDEFECVKCGEGMKCTGLLLYPQAQPGYIATGDESQMLKCHPPKSCNWAVTSDIYHRPGNGSQVSYCSKGYEGVSCNLCVSGSEGERYYRTNSHCMKCPTMSIFSLVPIYLAGGVAVLGVCGVIVHVSRAPKRLVMMMVTYLQLVASVKGLGLKWSPATESVLEATTPLNFNLQSLAPECDVPVNYESRWLSGQIFPLLLVTVLGFLKVLSGALSGVIERGTSNMKWKVRSDQVSMSLKGLVSTSLRFLLLLYLSLLTSTLNIFDCVGRGDGKSVLVVEPSIVCDAAEDPRYGRLKGLAVFFIILYVIGIPLLVLSLLLWSRSVGPDTAVKKVVKESVHFLLKPYKAEYYYWKLVEMARKVSIVTLPRLISSEYPDLQGSILISLFGAFIVHNYFACPYTLGERGGDFYNSAEFVCYVCLIVIISCGVSLNSVIEKVQYLSAVANVKGSDLVGSYGLVFTVLALMFLLAGIMFLVALGYKYGGNRAATVSVEGLVEKGGHETRGDLALATRPPNSTFVSMNPVAGYSKSASATCNVPGGDVTPASSPGVGESSAQMKALQRQVDTMKQELMKERAHWAESLEQEKREKEDLLKAKGLADSEVASWRLKVEELTAKMSM